LPLFFFKTFEHLMEEIVKALQQWADYRRDHPESTFEDFCRFHLASHKKNDLKALAETEGPPDLDSLFMMTVARSTLAFWVYMRIAIRGTPLSSIESIMLCAALHNLGESRKGDVINHSMIEISTGTGILNRLIEKGIINQRVDGEDKRSKLLSLSTAGQSALKKCFKMAGLAREIFLVDTTDDDKRIVAQILNPLQKKHSKLAVESKGKTIEEIHARVVDRKKKD
jgi:DNA-binding MarR family transcriptional regulator